MLIFNSVWKIYNGGGGEVIALSDINMHIRHGEFVALLGESGCGKSTVMNIAGCLDNVTRGSVKIDGNEVCAMNEDELAKTRSNTIGFIFQAFYLQSHLTAVENVMLPMMITGLREKERIKRANELLKAVGVYDRALHKPSEMSGGQRQRVCIARALANNPRLILADEPTGNLDSKTALSVVELLKSLTKNGITVLMVTHNNTHAKMADRVLRIENGIIE